MTGQFNSYYMAYYDPSTGYYAKGLTEQQAKDLENGAETLVLILRIVITICCLSICACCYCCFRRRHH